MHFNANGYESEENMDMKVQFWIHPLIENMCCVPELRSTLESWMIMT